MATRNLTIMFTDIKGFTQKTSEETRAELNNMITEHEKLLVPVFNYFGGKIVKTIGDAFLVYFDSPTDAVLAGLTIQEVLRQHNSFNEEKKRLNVRVSINVGDVEMKDGDVMGEPVNLAARLEGITEAGEVYFTEAVFLSMNRKEVPSTEVGERTFKGIPYSVKVYKVIQDPKSDQAKRIALSVRLTEQGPIIKGLRQTAQEKKPVLAWVIAGAAVCAVAAVVYFGFISKKQDDSQSPRNISKTRAETLLQQGQFLSALEEVDPFLKKDPADVELRDIALKSAQGNLTFLERERTRNDAFAWLTKALEEKPYLESLQSRVPVMDTEVTLYDILEGRTRLSGGSNAIFEKAGEIIRKYPKDADVPFVAAEIIQKQYIIEACLWMYEESLKRGHKADQKIFNAILRVFGGNKPDDCKRARDLSKQYYSKDRAEWARKAIDEEVGCFYMNAFFILREEGDSKVKDSYYQQVYNIYEAKYIGDACGALAAEKNQGKAKRAISHLKEIFKERDEGNYKASDTNIQKLQETLNILNASWGKD